MLKLQMDQYEYKIQPVVIFVQFVSMNGVKKFKKTINKSLLYRIYLYITCRSNLIEHIYLYNSVWPYYEDPPVPRVVLWNNLGVLGIQKYCRIFFVTTIQIILCLGSFVSISWFTNDSIRVEDNSLQSNFSLFACPRNITK